MSATLENAEPRTTRLPIALSDLTFNYIVCARYFLVDNKASGEINHDEEDTAIDILLRLFNHTMGYEFTREDLLAEVERRT